MHETATTTTNYPNIPPPLASSHQSFKARKKAWMQRTKKSTNFENANGIVHSCDDLNGVDIRNDDTRDDHQDNNNIKEERNRLSLCFSIDHYCIMIEKVYISFLKLFKHHCASLSDNPDEMHHRMKAHVLGKRIQIFLKEVLPSHIHYHTNFKGRQQITAVETQVDEYMEILTLTVKDNHDCNYTGSVHFEDSFASTATTDFNSSAMSGDDDKRQKTHYEDHYDHYSRCSVDQGGDVGHYDRRNEHSESRCEVSSISTSYHDDWRNEFECTEYNDEGYTDEEENGFILKLETKDDDDNNDSKKKLNSDDFEHHDDIPDFKFKTLVTHWRAQERKWSRSFDPANKAT